MDRLDRTSFELVVEHAGATMLVRPRGEIDLGAEAELLALVSVLPPCEVIVLDVGGATFMDLSGLRFLSALRHRAERGGTLLLAAGRQRQPRRLLSRRRNSATCSAARPATPGPAATSAWAS